MSKTLYINADGAHITKEAWQERRSDSEYCTVKRFDNGKVLVEVEWVGEVKNYQNLWPADYPVFRLTVANYRENGEAVPDPVFDDTSFPDKDFAIQAYTNFLSHWTESGVNEDGVFEEVDNIYTPPPPPNFDAPTSDLSTIKGIEDDGVGAW